MQTASLVCLIGVKTQRKLMDHLYTSASVFFMSDVIDMSFISVKDMSTLHVLK